MNYDNSSWINFWRDEKITRDIIWRQNMQIFISNSTNLMNYSSSDVVLDIGSGPCTIVNYLKDKVKEIHCVDISDQYMEKCRENFGDESNIFIYKLNPDNYTDLSFLSGKKFTKIVCLSVVQYYNNSEEVINLISQVDKISESGAKFIIADIPTSPGKLTDILDLLKLSAKNGFFFDTINYLIKHKTSSYDKIRKNKGLLILSEKNISAIVDQLQLNAKLLNIQLTTNKHRKHLLINF